MARNWFGKTFQNELADAQNLHRPLNIAGHDARNKDLPAARLRAQAGGEIGDTADGRIVAPAFKTDGTDGCNALGDADSHGKTLVALLPDLVEIQDIEGQIPIKLPAFEI